MGHTTAMFFRGLIATILFAVSIALSNLPAVAQSPLRSGLPRDLQFHRRSQGSASGRYALRSAFVSRAWA